MRNLTIAFAFVGLLAGTAGTAAAQECVATLCGDVDASGSITAGDALRVLTRAVGQTPEMTCVCEAGASACPNVEGAYQGTVTATLTGCSDPSDNGQATEPFGPMTATQSGCAVTLRNEVVAPGERELIEIFGDLSQAGTMTSGLFKDWLVESDFGEYIEGTVDATFAGVQLTGSLSADSLIGDTCHLEATFDLTLQQ